ncbi:MAG: hypothetical protein AAGK97_15795, partial [Bacteroidota bacterium]
KNLPAGNYQVTVTDANGCSVNKVFNINGSNGNISATYNVTPSSCNGLGSIGIDIIGGNAPFTVIWNGPVSGTLNSNNRWVGIDQLPAGTYWIKIKDASGCQTTQYVSVNGSGGNVHITVYPHNGSCGNNGSIFGTVSGTSPFVITWTGPQAGSINTDGPDYNISNLASGDYTIKVTDHNGCMKTKYTSIHNSQSQLEVTGTTGDASCTGTGSIWLDISNGTAPFSIAWSGPESGAVSTNSDGFDITGLSPGTYQVTVTDDNGCSKTVTFVVANQGGGLTFNSMVMEATCDSFGVIWINEVTGVPPFTFEWTGSATGSHTTNNNAYDIGNLPAGMVTVTVTDANGCSKTETFDLGDGNNPPMAGFTYTVDGLDVAFNNTADTDNLTWTFGDGGNSNNENPTYDYCDPG